MASSIFGNSPLAFKTIAVSGQSDIVADAATDTLTVVGSNITVTTNATTDTLTLTGSAATAPGGSGSELQYRSGASTFGGITGSSWDPVLGRLDLLNGDAPGPKHLSVGDSGNVATGDTVHSIVQLGNGLAASADGFDLDNVIQTGASLALILTDSGSTPDIVMVGEHITVDDTVSEQGYGLVLGGGVNDVGIRGGQGWVVIQAGGAIDADGITNSVLIGGDLNISNSGDPIEMLVVGFGHTVNDESEVSLFGRNHTADHSNVTLVGEGITSTGSNQAWFGGPARKVFFTSSAAGFMFDHSLGAPGFIGDWAGAQLATPSIEFVGAAGTTGATTYTYKVVARTVTGHSAASANGTVTDGNAVLDGTNYNEIYVTTIPGGFTYDLYRTVGGGSQGLIASVSQLGGQIIFADTGLAGDAATAPATNDTGNLYLPNGAAVRSNTTTAHTAKIQVYDVNGAAYRDVLVLTNGDAPDATFTPPTTGTLVMQATTYKSSDGTSGATAGPFTVISSIQVKNGLVTTLTGT